MNVKAISDYQGEGRKWQHAIFTENISKLKFEPEDIVLDVGCDTGEETKFIASKVAHITGFDILEKMIAEARKNNLGPNITYSVWDVRTCGENPDWRERFDKAFSNCTCHWVPVPEASKALQNILTCLKPKGEALFTIANRTDMIKDMTQYAKSHCRWGVFVQDYEPPPHTWELSESEIEDLFSTSGWTDVRCELKRNRCSLNAAQTKLLWKSVELTMQIPEEFWEEYLEDALAETQTRYGDPAQPGSVSVQMEHAVVYATKP